jgi:hypothetical protein
MTSDRDDDDDERMGEKFQITMMMMMVTGKETMKRFAETMLEKLEWGGRDEQTVLALAKKYRMTGKAEAVEKALENMQTFDEVEAAVQASDSRGGTVIDRRGDYRGCGTIDAGRTGIPLIHIVVQKDSRRERG